MSEATLTERLLEEADGLALMSYHGFPWQLGGSPDNWAPDMTKECVGRLEALLRSCAVALQTAEEEKDDAVRRRAQLVAKSNDRRREEAKRERKLLAELVRVRENNEALREALEHVLDRALLSHDTRTEMRYGENNAWEVDVHEPDCTRCAAETLLRDRAGATGEEK